LYSKGNRLKLDYREESSLSKEKITLLPELLLSLTNPQQQVILKLTITEGNKQKRQDHFCPASLFVPSINQKV